MARKSQLNRGVFAATPHALGVLRGQRGECCNFQPDAVAELNIPIYLILLWLSVDSRTVLRRRSKIGEDGSAPPPLEEVPIGPSRGCDIARLDSSSTEGALPSLSKWTVNS